MRLPAALKRNLTVGVKRNNRFFSSPLIHLDCSLAFVVAKVMRIVGKKYVLLCYNVLKLWLPAGGAISAGIGRMFRRSRGRVALGVRVGVDTIVRVYG